MQIIKDVFPIEAYFCACANCDRIQLIQNIEFKYFPEEKATGAIKYCNKCGDKLFIIKPEGD